MIIDKFVIVHPRNKAKYWSEILRQPVSYHDELKVPIELLPTNSNKFVKCSCDECSVEFERSYQIICRTSRLISLNKQLCEGCARKSNSEKSSLTQKGKSREFQREENHPRWNPNKSDFQKYSNKVRWLTRKKRHIWSSWPNADKISVCGKKDGYQLDHKVSIRYGFDNHIVPELIADVRNLEIISWQKNRIKHKSNSIDLWELLL